MHLAREWLKDASGEVLEETYGWARSKEREARSARMFGYAHVYRSMQLQCLQELGDREHRAWLIVADELDGQSRLFDA